MSTARIFSGIMALVFIFAAAVQWNDPDPLIWILAYSAVALLAGAHARTGSTQPWVCFVLAACLTLPALSLLGSLLQADASAFTSVGMKDDTAEEARECLGLLIAASYAGGLGLAARFHRTRR